MRGTYEWKSATIALSPSGIGMYSFPAPLMMVRGTALIDTIEVVSTYSCNSTIRVPDLLIDDLLDC